MEQMTGEQIYFILNRANKAIKIGITRNITWRLKDIQAHNASELICVKLIDNGTKNDESEYHLQFKDYHIHGEWFRLEGELEKYLSESIADASKHIHVKFRNNTIIKAAKTAEERNEFLDIVTKLHNDKKENISLKRAAAGYLGGVSTFKQKGPEGMRAMGKLGGRPRLGTLEELMANAGDSKQEERRALPGVTAPFKLSNILKSLVMDKKESGGRQASAPMLSTEGGR